MSSQSQDNRIGGYFAVLEARLTKMPAARRDGQIQELHQHLSALIHALVQQGLSHEGAVSQALTQMGDPVETGRKLMHEWRIDPENSLWQVRYATVFGLGALTLCYSYGHSNASHENQYWSLMYIVAPIFSGFVTGVFFPKHAVKAMIRAVTFTMLIMWVSYLIAPLVGHPPNTAQDHWNFIRWLTLQIGLPWYVLGTLTAAAVSSIRRGNKKALSQ